MSFAKIEQILQALSFSGAASNSKLRSRNWSTSACRRSASYAFCATIPAPIKYVESKLPAGLRLITPAKWGDFHPILLVFSRSRQRNVRPGFLPLGINYHEFLECIPNVERCAIH